MMSGTFDYWYRSRLVYTPFEVAVENKSAVDSNRFWGTYRPQVLLFLLLGYDV